MALELQLEVRAETREAEASLGRVDKAVQSIADQAKAADKRLEDGFRALDKTLQQVEKDAKAAEAAQKRTSNSTDALSSALMRYAGPAAIGAAAMATMQYAGRITDLAAKTGMSVEAVQKLGGAAEDVGVSLDQISTSVAMLGNRLAGGDKNVVSALKSLGLSMQEIRNSSPDQAFLKIADALGEVEDWSTKSHLAVQLFGRSGLTLLPALTKDFADAARAAAAMGEETAKSLDKTEDSISQLYRSGRVLLAEVLAPLAPILTKIAEAASFAGTAMREMLSASRDGLMNEFARQWNRGGQLPENFSQQAIPLAVGAGANLGAFTPDHAFELLTAQVVSNADGMRVLRGRTNTLIDRTAELAEHARHVALRWRNLIATSDWLAARMGQVAMGFTASGLTPTTPLGGQMNPWGGIAAPVPFGGGSNYSGLTGGSRLGTIGATAFNALSPLVGNMLPQNRGTQVGGMLGGLGASLGVSLGSIGGALGSVLPGIGTIAGMAIGSLLGKLFGPSRGAVLGKEADARIGQSQAGLLQEFGSVEAIAAMGPAGAALADAWGSKNVQGEQWFNRLTDAFREQLSLQEQITSVEEQRAALVESLVPTWEQLTTAAARYGFDVSELGREVQQIGTSASFKTILEDLQLFGRATQDTGAYLSRMADEISVAVQQALRFGTEVPANMRAYIEELARTGQLLDENGEAITDLSSIRWGAAIETQADLVNAAIAKLNESFDSLTEKLEQLFDRLANGLPAAAERGARGAQDALNSVEPPEFRYGGGGGGEEATGYARGGLVYAARGYYARGTDVVPAMLTPGEFVMSAAATRRIGASTLAALNRGGGAARTSSPVVVQVVLDGRVVAESAARHLPDVLPAYGV